MTNIIIYRDGHGQFKGFEMMGHAGQAEYGQDIVCASMSVLAINTVNSLEQLTRDKLEVETDEQIGRISLRFCNGVSKEATLLMNSFVLGMEGIEEAYGSRYIKVSFKEV